MFVNKTNEFWSQKLRNRFCKFLALVLVCACLPIAESKSSASGSLYFNGTTNSYMQFTGAFFGAGQGSGQVADFTLEFWLRSDSNVSETIFTNFGHSVGAAWAGNSGSYDITTGSDGSVNMDYSGDIWDATSYRSSLNSGPNLIIPLQWQYVAITRQIVEPNHEFENCIYFNGSLVSTNLDWQFEPIIWAADSPPLLGQGFAGAIGEFREWNRPLSQTEIQTKMNQILNPTNEVGLFGYWRFTEGTNNIVHDLAGTNDGLIQGAYWSSDLPSQPFQPPTITQQPTNQTVYNGMSNLVLSIAVTGSQPIFYQWALNNTNITGATSSTLIIPKAGLKDLGVYSVVVTNIAGTVTSSNAILSMVPYISSPFAGTTVLWGQNANLSVNPAGTGPFYCQWYENGVLINGATNQTFTISSIQFTNAGFYSVVVTSLFGSVTNIPAQVVVNPAGVLFGTYPGLTITGTVGYAYSIQATPNLTNTNGWNTVANLTLQQTQQLWIDTSVNASDPANPHYFYRVVPQQ
jgi:hypothetical protein